LLVRWPPAYPKYKKYSVFTSRFIEVRKVGQVIAGFEHGRIHQRGEFGGVAGLEVLEGNLQSLGLFAPKDDQPQSRDGIREQIVRTSPLSNWKTSETFEPSTVFLITSEATQPSVGSGCQALVPTS